MDATIAALRGQIERLQAEQRRPSRTKGARLANSALAKLRSHLPNELAAKAQAVAPAQGERRQVTVLFADLSGFTAVSELADPEVIQAFQRDLFRDLARIIYQHEGFVEKFVGDAILAVFGAPVAHEDDPERALRVALAMRERIAVLNRRWSERLGARVTLHIGVNTGLVVAGKIGSDLDSDGGAYAVSGDTVNSAARLQNAAQPGQILVSRTTYRLAQEAFTFQALEPVQVKNRREPLDVYELTRARYLPGKMRGVRELGQSFVGREAVLAQLEAVITSLGEGESARTVLITGEAGLGKSRLVAELCKSTRDRVLWLEGRCFAHTQMLPYGPFLDMLRRDAGILDDDSQRRARQRLDVAAERLLPGDAEARAILANLLAMQLRRDEAAFIASLSARELRERVFRLAEQLVRGLAVTRPVVVFLEDMQWVDQTTLELIEHLLTACDSLPLAVVMAARPEAEAPVVRFYSRLQDSHGPRTLRIELQPLDASASGKMMRELLSVTDLPPNLAELIANKAEGNPFFVEETIRALIERGALQKQGATWVTTPLMETVTVPDTLQGLIMARIDRLPDETKDVVQHAAVIGRTFLYRVLLAIAGTSPTLDADLSHLERSELILEQARDPEVAYMFKHALTQEMAYESLLASRRRELHLRVGEAMERIFAGRLAEYYAIVGEHYSNGGEWAKAAESDYQAALQASQHFAPEARGLFEKTLDELDRVTPKTAVDVKRRIIDATVGLSRQVLMGAGKADPEDIEMCLGRLGAAEELARSLPQSNKDDQLRVARVYGWMAQAESMRGDPARKVSQHVARIQELDLALEPEIAARVGQLFLHRGLFNQAIAVLRPAITPLVGANLLIEWVHANGALALAEAGSGDYKAGLERAEGGVQRASKFPGNALNAPARNYLANTLLMGGEWQRAAEINAQNAEHVGKMGHPAVTAIFDTLTCVAHARRGDYELGHTDDMKDILNDVQKPREEASHTRPSEQQLLDAWHAAFHAQMAFQAEDMRAAIQHADAAVQAGHNRGDVFGEGVGLRIKAQALAADDLNHPDIDALMRESRDLLAKGGCEIELARTLSAWGYIQLQRGNLDGKDRLLSALRTYETAGLTWEAARIRPLI